MDKNAIDALVKSTLFLGLGKDEIPTLLDKIGYELSDCERESEILSPHKNGEKMGILIEGRLDIMRCKPDGSAVFLNSISCGECFGLLSALRPECEPPTSVVARKRSTVLFLSGAQLLEMVSRDSRISVNLISFMADRIAFLNKKIATFSSDSVIQKLSRYILSLYEQTGVLEIEFNKNKVSHAINSGRASLYRALEQLAADGVISYDSKKIYIKDLLGLERIAQ